MALFFKENCSGHQCLYQSGQGACQSGFILESMETKIQSQLRFRAFTKKNLPFGSKFQPFATFGACDSCRHPESFDRKTLCTSPLVFWSRAALKTIIFYAWRRRLQNRNFENLKVHFRVFGRLKCIKCIRNGL